MKSISFNILFALVFLLLTSCGANEGAPGVEPRPRIALHLQLPAALERGSPRFQRFLARVISLELRVRSKEGFSARHIFGPAQWEGIFLGGLDFPRSPTDVLTIEFRAWDRKADGLPRAFAALSGKKRIRAAEMGQEQKLEIPLRLSLNVGAREY